MLKEISVRSDGGVLAVKGIKGFVKRPYTGTAVTAFSGDCSATACMKK